MKGSEPLHVNLRTHDDIGVLRDAIRSIALDAARPMPPLVIELPGGVMEWSFDIDVGLVGPAGLDITLLGNGTTITHGTLQLVGSRINVKDVVFDGSQQDEVVFQLHASDVISLDHVAVINLPERDTSSGLQTARGAYLYATGPKTTLTVRDSLFLGNQHGIAVRGFDTGMGFASARFENVRFAGNVSPTFYFGVIDRLEFLDSTRLGGTGEFAHTTVRTIVLSEPTERPADEGTLAAWRDELKRWGTVR